MTDAAPDSGNRGRGAAAVAGIILAVLAATLVSLAVDTVWMHHRIFDTDTFVETLAPLPKEPEISVAIATKAAEALSQAEVVEARVIEALPDRFGFLAPEIVDVVDEIVYETTILVVESDAFASVWESSLRAMHTIGIGILEGSVPATGGDDIGVDLDAAGRLISDRLEARGVDLFAGFDTSLGRIVIVQAEALAAPRSVIEVFRTAVWLFPLAAMLVLGIAIAVDRDRLRPVQWFGLGSAVAILISLATVRALANLAVRAIDDPIGRSAAGAVWDALLGGYFALSAVAGVVMLAVGLGALTWRRLHRSPMS